MNKLPLFLYHTKIAEGTKNLKVPCYAAMAEGLIEYPNSYLIADQKSFQFLKDIKLKEIPRYIIVDKSGKIVNTNAPPPDSKELKNILNQLLR